MMKSAVIPTPSSGEFVPISTTHHVILVKDVDGWMDGWMDACG
jgi:hypothetical protein